MNTIFNVYSGLEILEHSYNNYYKRIVWPTFLCVGEFVLVVPCAVLIAKWELVSGDPRLIILFSGIGNGLLIAIVMTSCGSKLNQIAVDLLTKTCTEDVQLLRNAYFNRRLKSKKPLAVRVASNFMDPSMRLSVVETSISNVISLLMVLNQ